MGSRIIESIQGSKKSPLRSIDIICNLLISIPPQGTPMQCSRRHRCVAQSELQHQRVQRVLKSGSTRAPNCCEAFCTAPDKTSERFSGLRGGHFRIERCQVDIRHIAEAQTTSPPQPLFSGPAQTILTDKNLLIFLTAFLLS